MSAQTINSIGSQNLDRASCSEFDLIVVGGGITGCWATLLAAQRGLQVCLVESGDFGSGTSRVSHRILHGGFRYLQKMDLSRLRESVAERRSFFRAFPELVLPLPCLMPLYGEGLKRPSAFRAAAMAYGILAAGQNRGIAPSLRLPAAGVLTRDQTKEVFRGVRTEGLVGGGLWHDGLLLSHARVTMTILRQAASLGAVCLNHTPAIGLLTHGDRVTGVRVQQGDRPVDLRADRVLNAASTGASSWANELAEAPTALVNPALAFNLLLDRPPVSSHGIAVDPPKANAVDEERTYFLVPRAGCIAAGTTHRPAGAAGAGPLVTGEMVQGMLSDLNAAIPSLSLSPGDILRVDAGLVPTDAKGGREPSDRPTVVDHASLGGLSGLVSAISVKYTTARHTARRGLGLALGSSGSGASERVPKVTPELPVTMLVNPRPTGDQIMASSEQILAMCEVEGVCSLTDLVVGRTEWGEHPAWALEAAEPLSELLADHFGWDAGRKQDELESLAHALPGSMPKMGGIATTSGGDPAS